MAEGNTQKLALRIMANLEKAAQILDEPKKDGKLFGYDNESIANALTTEEDTIKLLNTLYNEVDNRFGTDPMYYGVASTEELEYYLKKEGLIREYPNERNDISI